MNKFRQWWMSSTVFVFLLYLLEQQYGGVSLVFIADNTRISAGIAATVVVTCGAIGFKSWHGTGLQGTYYLWFITERLFQVGLFGTMVGAYIMFSSNLDISSAESTRDFLFQFFGGMGTAILTTITALVGSMFLQLQLTVLEAKE